MIPIQEAIMNKQKIGLRLELAQEQEDQIQVIEDRIEYVKSLRYYSDTNKQRRIDRLELLKADIALGTHLTSEYLSELIEIARCPVDSSGSRFDRDYRIGDYHTIQDYQAIGKTLNLL